MLTQEEIDEVIQALEEEYGEEYIDFMAKEEYIYKNEDEKCECWKCELQDKCPYKDKYQRLPRTVKGALGLCKKLK